MAASKRRAVRRRRGRGAADFGVYRGRRQRRIRRRRLRHPTRRRAASVRVFGNLSLSSQSLSDTVGNRCGGASVKSLIIFDLDGTLAESKSALDAEMAALLGRLLRVVKVAIISGGAWPQYEEQVLSNLPSGDILKKLSLLPTCGTKFYRFDGAWRSLYSEDFSADEKISAILKPLIPDFSVQIGGSTSIDVTRPGIDKGYGVRKLQETLGVAIRRMIFVGDAIFPGGNDYPAKRTGVTSIAVRDPHETKRVIEAIIPCLERDDDWRQTSS